RTGALERGAGRGRELERAGHANDDDVVRPGAMPLERVESAPEKSVGDRRVPASAQHREAQSGSVGVPFHLRRLEAGCDAARDTADAQGPTLVLRLRYYH